MNAHTLKDPLHGVTLEMQINSLVAKYGWAELAKRININCFKSDPSVKSSLKFLRRTPWARAEVEALYLASLTGKTAPHIASAAKAAPPAAEDPWGNWRGGKPA
ncbi:VF530 family DNA-binding protein [Pantoea sp. NSTU24]|uniref:VF530 family protein n=1 Tax=Pantoea sp. NSTU24 TaxID=3391144 RepID=UPI003D073999